MHILALIPTWKRPEIASICYRGLQRIQSEALASGYNITPLVVASRQPDAHLAETVFKMRCVSSTNQPLGKKLNRGLAYAIKKMDWGYMMTLGSDDLLAQGFFAPDGWIGKSSIHWHLERKTPFFGCNELYVYDTNTGQAKYANTLNPFGAARFIRRDIAEAVVKKKGFLWEPERNQGLDGSSERMIGEIFTMHEVRVMPVHNDGFPMVLDMKGAENIHPYDEIPGEHLIGAQTGWMQNAFPELELIERKQIIATT